ncbi:DNA-binding response regulator [Aquabacterium olei]|jgi:DNA-binding NarL/FixJ family response regulator|uniref:DNA-binding response regulator n=1 Tax=Aquabacterium olei TaxID=1296669 RepID=A0A2U8FRQ0_9BURK|nr:response regulator transcription factor [Aquabacterium olei]AWI53745.1 DNA-binding response regulator [Aquabacterium olei]
MRVLLIDDHPLILSALQSVIQGLGDNVTVDAADSGHAARQALRTPPAYDLVLLDLHLGDVDGFDLLAEFRTLYPALPVVVISASDRTSDVIRAIDMGAMGFVPKRATNETLFDALQQVMSGGVYVPPMSMGAHSHTQLSSSPALRQVQREAVDSGFQTMPSLTQLGLTPRQADVLGLLLKGQPNKLIARELGLSVETVKDHVAAVLRALGVSSRTQAVIAVSQILQKTSVPVPTVGGMGVWRPR